MLPSERLARLAGKAVVVAVRKSDPEAEALRREFDARATAWLVVLDPRGELLDGGPADRSGAFKKKETAAAFAGPFFDRAEAALKRTESLQDLERRWDRDPGAEAAFEALAARLEELGSYTRLRERCERTALLPGLSPDRRADALLRAFAAKPREFNPSTGTPEGRARFAEEGERLVAAHAARPACARAVEALFLGGYSGGFDLPGRSAAGIARLEAAARTQADPAALRGRIEELSRLRDGEIVKLRAAREAAKGNEASEGWCAAVLGDAEAVLRIFTKPEYAKSATYRSWVDEARKKLEPLK